MTRTCPICGEEFETNPSRKVHKYCSKTCARRAGARRQTARKTAARKAARRPRLCPVCGTEFTPACNRQRFCSPKCRDLIKRGRELARRVRRRKERRLEMGAKPKSAIRNHKSAIRNHKSAIRNPQSSIKKTCPICGKEFAPSAKHPEVRYCSRPCANLGIAAAIRGRLPPRKCEWCGKEFKPRATWQQYCSTECRRGAKYNRERAEPQSAIVNLQSSIAKVRAYLSLTPAERWARHKELNAAEHKIAQRMYAEDHASRCVAVNW